MNEIDIAAGLQQCLFGVVSSFCGRPAVLHVWIDDEQGCTMTCERHLYWWDYHPYVDQHPIVGACGLPDTDWVSAEDDPAELGYCLIEGLPVAALVGAATRTG